MEGGTLFARLKIKWYAFLKGMRLWLAEANMLAKHFVGFPHFTTEPQIKCHINPKLIYDHYSSYIQNLQHFLVKGLIIFKF